MVQQRPLPSVEKKRARSSGGKSFVKEVLLKPTIWKAGVKFLDFVLKLFRVGAKIWEMFE